MITIHWWLIPAIMIDFFFMGFFFHADVRSK